MPGLPIDESGQGDDHEDTLDPETKQQIEEELKSKEFSQANMLKALSGLKPGPQCGKEPTKVPVPVECLKAAYSKFCDAESDVASDVRILGQHLSVSGSSNNRLRHVRKSRTPMEPSLRARAESPSCDHIMFGFESSEKHGECLETCQEAFAASLKTCDKDDQIPFSVKTNVGCRNYAWYIVKALDVKVPPPPEGDAGKNYGCDAQTSELKWWACADS